MITKVYTLDNRTLFRSVYTGTYLDESQRLYMASIGLKIHPDSNGWIFNFVDIGASKHNMPPTTIEYFEFQELVSKICKHLNLNQGEYFDLKIHYDTIILTMKYSYVNYSYMLVQKLFKFLKRLIIRNKSWLRLPIKLTTT